MKARNCNLNPIVTAVAIFFFAAVPTWAQGGAGQSDLDGLFDRLKTASAQEAADIESEIWLIWSKSGSAAMDLLLERGRAAMAAGDTTLAVEHLTALVDHAPDFAEGWNARATAYFQAGELGPSLADIGKTLTLNPRHFGALSGLGAIFETLEAPEKAIEAYRAAQEINPHALGLRAAIERLDGQIQGQDL